jgi:RNA polymerase sigma-70 factor (ECF subfamily)
MSNGTDSQLVARVRAGDLSAFEAIVTRHRAALIATSAAVLGSVEEAEDAAQEAFVTAFFRLHQLRTPESLHPWLRRLAERVALAHLRGRREEPMEAGELDAIRTARDAAVVDAGDARSELLALLPEAMRQTVRMVHLEGYTCAEAASLLGVREGTVKSRLSRARAVLREAVMTEKQAGKSAEEFTQETVERLMREARRLMAEGKIEEAGAQAEHVLVAQAQMGFAKGGAPDDLAFDADAARIAGAAYREKRLRDCEGNARQYGHRLEDLDWQVDDVDVMQGTRAPRGVRCESLNALVTQ